GRIVRGDVAGAIPAAAFALLCVALGAAAAWRRRDTALIATAVGGLIIYAAARHDASIYVQAKALAVIAPILAFAALKGLLGPWRAGGGVPTRERARLAPPEG